MKELRAHMGKVEYARRTGHVSRELEILQGTKMIQGIKNTITEMKNVFDGLINRLDMA